MAGRIRPAIGHWPAPRRRRAWGLIPDGRGRAGRGRQGPSARRRIPSRARLLPATTVLCNPVQNEGWSEGNKNPGML